MDASHNHLVSGVIVQQPKEPEFDKVVKKLLGKRILDKSKLVKAVGEQRFGRAGDLKAPTLRESELTRDCILVDEQWPSKKTSLRLGKNCCSLELVSGLHEKRRMK